MPESEMGLGGMAAAGTVRVRLNQLVLMCKQDRKALENNLPDGVGLQAEEGMGQKHHTDQLFAARKPGNAALEWPQVFVKDARDRHETVADTSEIEAKSNVTCDYKF
jgi:hypothetical protein